MWIFVATTRIEGILNADIRSFYSKKLKNFSRCGCTDKGRESYGSATLCGQGFFSNSEVQTFRWKNLTNFQKL